MTNPLLPSLTPADLRALLAIDRALARVGDALDDARSECQAHPRPTGNMAGIMTGNMAGIMADIMAKLEAAHPADRLLRQPEDEAEYIDLTDGTGA
jgi:hypothetical protein